MKNILRLFIPLLLILLVGCSTIRVDVDYDKKKDFSQYKTYKLMKQNSLSDFESIYKNALNKKRFANAIDEQLKMKGFEKTDSKPDFLVVYHLRFDKKLDVTSYGYKYYPASGYTERYVQTRVYQQGSVVLDIIDKKEQLLVWRGSVEGVLNERNDPEDMINETIKAILKDFPPK